MKDVLQGATLIVNVGDSQREVSMFVSICIDYVNLHDSVMYKWLLAVFYIRIFDRILVNHMKVLVILTFRGLSLFFKILPISNTGDSIAYILATVHFLYPKFGSFSDMEYYFYQLAFRDSKVPKRFVGLN